MSAVEGDFTADIAVAAPGWDRALGGDAEAFAVRILGQAAAAEGAAGGVAVLLTDDAEMAALNRFWRGKDAPTNVLSFPAAAVPGAPLGDIALGLETVLAEAESQEKSPQAHAAHLLVHGLLHLLGYDHELDEDAERMEARERAILAEMGFPDPYMHDA